MDRVALRMAGLLQQRSPASPWKTPYIRPLLLGLTLSVNLDSYICVHPGYFKQFFEILYLRSKICLDFTNLNYYKLSFVLGCIYP